MVVLPVAMHARTTARRPCRGRRSSGVSATSWGRTSPPDRRVKRARAELRRAKRRLQQGCCRSSGTGSLWTGMLPFERHRFPRHSSPQVGIQAGRGPSPAPGPWLSMVKEVCPGWRTYQRVLQFRSGPTRRFRSQERSLPGRWRPLQTRMVTSSFRRRSSDQEGLTPIG